MSASYRLQIRPEQDLSAAARLVPYLRSLGITTLHLSPLLPSSHGSAHGYDVIAWDRIDPQRGGEDGWAELRAAAAKAGMSLLVDIVPNHCSIAVPGENVPWASVQSSGRRSPFAHWFDIEWDGERIAWYRRFLTIGWLAGLRVEAPDVFEATHATVLRWVRAQGVTGLRIDHLDGLADPAGYLARLRSAVGADCRLLVEKVLQPGQTLPGHWPVQGTTGYDALAEVSAVLTAQDGAGALTAAYRELTGDERSFTEHALAAKHLVATSFLLPEVRRLHRANPALSEATITEALVRMTAYRDYDLSSEYTTRFGQVCAALMAKGVEDTAFYRYSRFIALNEVGGDPELFEHRGHTAPGAQSGTQSGTAPSAESGTESAVAHWHLAQQRRQQYAPGSMTTLSTHDTKRSEDVRARLAVLAEIPQQWAALARHLMSAAPLPDRAFAYLLWQTFTGTGFIDPARMHGYAEKAMREAGTHTSWPHPEPGFEHAVHAVIDRAYDEALLHEPLARFCQTITPYGWANSLSGKLLQLTMPGVPDVYQGAESWDYSLADPDNRRPVDFAALQARLAALDAAGVAPPVDASGDAKLWLTSRVLRARREHPGLFSAYRRLHCVDSQDCAAPPADGPQADGPPADDPRSDGRAYPAAEHAIAYDRGGAIVIATRLPFGLERAGGWGSTEISLPGDYIDVLTGRGYGGRTRLAGILSSYPAALLLPS